MAGKGLNTCSGSPGKTCGKIVGDSDGIQCSLCNGWFHAHCQGLNKTVMNYFSNPKVSFFCFECNDKELPILKQGRDVFKDIAGRVEVLEQNFKENALRIAKLEENADFANSKDFHEAIGKSVDERLDEFELKMRKKNNIIIMDVPESESAQPADRKSDDINKVGIIYNKLTSETLDHNKIIACFRLQRNNNVSANKDKLNQPRMLKVVFSDEGPRTKLLKSTPNMKNLNEPLWISGLKIFPDLTIKERKERKKLVDERDLRNASQNDDGKKWTIRNLKLVQQTKNL